ncbi:MAG: copper homeostasis membrane protein CopD [Sphingomonas sp.]|uniref:copper homeostasis membrane protein CopD n=1 Tax=Sphingomonas sp. TaxID=28214 RepID=UPI0017D902E0|nr:copper homeostasis membrane protein CopD [Sphingomonas sp.]MBA3666633.1 copper homeostasis membrane protein CopD [Sphingomonas sp.]
MPDWALVTLRLGLYIDLTLLFGIGAYNLYGRWPARPSSRRILVGLAFAGVPLTVAAFLQMTANMLGTSLAEIDAATASMVLFETNPGTAALGRLAALAVAAVAAMRFRSTAGRGIFALSAAVALSSLAWSGHGAMSEGRVGWLHLVADIAHLLSAAAWVGALAMLLLAVFRSNDSRTAVEEAHAALDRFALAGTVIVALVLISGLVNSWILVGPDNVAALPDSLYGQLLIAKLVLFVAMLALASANRYFLTPRLGTALAAGDIRSAVTAVRVSVGAEISAAVIILALVAWFGTLIPPAAA